MAHVGILFPVFDHVTSYVMSHRSISDRNVLKICRNAVDYNILQLSRNTFPMSCTLLYAILSTCYRVSLTIRSSERCTALLGITFQFPKYMRLLPPLGFLILLFRYAQARSIIFVLIDFHSSMLESASQ